MFVIRPLRNLSFTAKSASYVGGVTQLQPQHVATYVTDYHDINLPEKRRLKVIPKVPRLLANTPKAHKMTKRLDLIRGREEIVTDFLYGQYGIVALQGGFLKSGHMEMIRMTILRRMDQKRMFAIWRVNELWKPHTKKGQGKRMGGGKGNVSFYTSPVKDQRVIIELGGKCSFEEVYPFLKIIADQLPFKAEPMTQQMIEERRNHLEYIKKANTNPYTFQYLIQNNMQENQIWRKQFMDTMYFGRYI